MSWTRFMDMHSGGGLKEKWQYIFIEAPEEEAAIIFQNRFGHNPYRVTCTCCGGDYSSFEEDTLEQLTGYDRNCYYDNTNDCYIELASSPEKTRDYQTIEEYEERSDVLIIRAEDIKDDERGGCLKTQGYVWID